MRVQRESWQERGLSSVVDPEYIISTNSTRGDRFSARAWDHGLGYKKIDTSMYPNLVFGRQI